MTTGSYTLMALKPCLAANVLNDDFYNMIYILKHSKRERENI